MAHPTTPKLNLTITPYGASQLDCYTDCLELEQQLSASFVLIDDFAQSVIPNHTGTVKIFVRVTGSNNVGPGLTVTLGGQVIVNAATVISGSGGGMQVGILSARSWADFRAPAGGKPTRVEYDGYISSGSGARVAE